MLFTSHVADVTVTFLRKYIYKFGEQLLLRAINNT